MAGGGAEEPVPEVVELNVGGVFYTTSRSTLTCDPDSLLARMFSDGGQSNDSAGDRVSRPLRDSKGRYFIDRDGVLFRYILDYLRDRKLFLPENFHERLRLKHEAEHYRLPDLLDQLDILGEQMPIFLPLPQSPTLPGAPTSPPGYISIGYRGTFAFGRDGLADVKFRKLTRILISGRVTLCREVFGDTLNESRDPDRGSEGRYSARFYLKHNFLEQAFDNLQEAGFRCVAACGSGTSCGGQGEPIKPGMDSEENRWNHYNEFIFIRP